MLPRFFLPPRFVGCTPVVRGQETLLYDYAAFLSTVVLTVELLMFDGGDCARQFVGPSVNPASALDPLAALPLSHTAPCWSALAGALFRGPGGAHHG